MADVIGNLAMKFKQDDGGVVYINGTEVLRSNMPSDRSRTPLLFIFRIHRERDAGQSTLVNGNNVIAVKCTRTLQTVPIEFRSRIIASHNLRQPYADGGR